MIVWPFGEFYLVNLLNPYISDVYLIAKPWRTVNVNDKER